LGRREIVPRETPYGVEKNLTGSGAVEAFGGGG
jgi:hypothetical protein